MKELKIQKDKALEKSQRMENTPLNIYVLKKVKFKNI